MKITAGWLAFGFLVAGCHGEVGEMGLQGEQGPQGVMGLQGEQGDPGVLDPNLAIRNGTTAQTANFNISGNGLLGGNLGIGTTTPAARLAIGPGFSPLVASPNFTLHAGTLTLDDGAELGLATFGFTQAASNTVSLGVRAHRTPGDNWTNTAIILGMDVDETLRAGASVTLHGNGNVGIGTVEPQAKLDVQGRISAQALQTQYANSTVQTITANAWNTITHDLNVPGELMQIVIVMNGDMIANNFSVRGTRNKTANSFEFYVEGGTSAALGRMDWIIMLK
jgi:hypothetical protein